ncbi:MAG TPA: sugar porter family MFS transporter [Candidatus Aminicenantes bacterium]|nr:sugar porter family MFS transporter [Candidatus Aminicenantes bacterium]HRY63896.1 sugar porter family MFS transporter [Candidatus Aminicenantes bacterium]HRZ70809.1 sugar porter family MFS transporter [Candidatus Aminicenantes bacterium]
MPERSSYNMRYVWTVTLVSAMGGLLFGYDWVVIGGAKPFYEKFFGLTTPSQIGWAMSSALAGCLVGALVSGGLSDRFGRKKLLILAGFLFTVTGVLTALAPSFAFFAANRLLGGVAIGLASNLSPMYIAEIAPPEIRGRLVSVNQLTIVIGILAAQIANWLIAEPVPAGATAAEILASWNGRSGWRWMFGAEAVPALLFFILMFFVPESPRWLIKKGRTAAAEMILARVGGRGFAAGALAEIRGTLAAGESGRARFRDLLGPGLGRVLLVGVALAVYQQWCGINVIFNYAQEIFTAAGYGVSGVLFNIVITGAVNLVFTLAAIRLVDRLGRRPLMLIGSAGLAAVFGLIGAGYAFHSRGLHILLLVLLALALYAVSLAPVTWVLLAEIFPNRIRGAAMSVSTFALWAACFVLTYTFPLLNRGLGPAGTFWIYAGISALGFLFMRSRVRETKGRTLEQIERELAGRSGETA